MGVNRSLRIGKKKQANRQRKDGFPTQGDKIFWKSGRETKRRFGEAERFFKIFAKNRKNYLNSNTDTPKDRTKDCLSDHGLGLAITGQVRS